MLAMKRKAEKREKSKKEDEAELCRLRDELLKAEADVDSLVGEVLYLRETCPETIMKLFTKSVESNLLKLENREKDEEYTAPEAIVDIENSLVDHADIDSLQLEKLELIRDLEKIRLRVEESDRHTDFLTSALTDNPVVVLPKARYLGRLADLSFM